LGDFGRPTGPGAGVRGDFSPKHPRMLRWASADLGPFSAFFAFLARLLPVFGPYFALFPSMSCAYLYVHNFPRTHVSRNRGRGIRGRRANLAFDKETAEATRNALSGRGLAAPAKRLAGMTKSEGRMTNQIRRPNEERRQAGEKQDGVAGNACRRKAENRNQYGGPRIGDFPPSVTATTFEIAPRRGALLGPGTAEIQFAGLPRFPGNDLWITTLRTGTGFLTAVLRPLHRVLGHALSPENGQTQSASAAASTAGRCGSTRSTCNDKGQERGFDASPQRLGWAAPIVTRLPLFRLHR